MCSTHLSGDAGISTIYQYQSGVARLCHLILSGRLATRENMTRNLTNSALIRTMVLLLLAASVPSIGVLGAAGASAAPAAGYSSRVAGEHRATEADRARRSKKKWKKAWIASWIAFAAVNILDAHSSTGHIEANPLLRSADGTFSARKAILVKALLGGGLFGAQLWMVKSHPDQNYYKSFTFATTGVAAGLGAIAVRNYGLPSPVSATASAATASAASPVLPEYLRRK